MNKAPIGMVNKTKKKETKLLNKVNKKLWFAKNYYLRQQN